MLRQETSTKILLVDDLPRNLLALRDILEEVDAELLCAGSGSEALLLATQHDFALILLDVQMPNMDGFEAASHLRNVDLTRHVPIIFVTALGHNRDMTFSAISVDGADVALLGISAFGLDGIYLWRSGNLVKIVDTNDSLDGDAISFVELGPDALDDDGLAFAAVFEDGSSALYIATVPEPGPGLQLAAACLTLAGLARRLARTQ